MGHTASYPVAVAALAVLGMSIALMIDPPNGGHPSRPPDQFAGRPAFHTPTIPILAELDTNGDGQLASEEIAVAADRLKRLDANQDGELTAEEYLGQVPRRAGLWGSFPEQRPRWAVGGGRGLRTIPDGFSPSTAPLWVGYDARGAVIRQPRVPTPGDPNQVRE